MESLGNIAEIGERDNRGNQTLSRLVDDIKAGGIKPTHFMLMALKFRRGIEKHKAANMRRNLFKVLNDVTYTHQMPDEDPLSIKWRCRNKSTSTIYYTTSRFEETYVRQLTKGLVRGAFNESLTREALTDHDVRVDFLITKNINFKIDLESGHQDYLGTIEEPRTPKLDINNRALVPVDEDSS
jgi:hypothetical protein